MHCAGSTGVALRDNDMAFFSTEWSDDFYVRDDLNRMEAVLGLFEHLYDSAQLGSAITDWDLKERLLRRKQTILQGRELLVEKINAVWNRTAFIKGNDEEYYVSDTTDGIILSIGNENFRMWYKNFRDVVTFCILKSLQGESVTSLFHEFNFGCDVACSKNNPDSKMKFKLCPDGKLLFSCGGDDHTFLLSRLDDECISILELNTSRKGVYMVRSVPFNISKDDTLLYSAIELCLRLESDTISMDTLEQARAEQNASHVF